MRALIFGITGQDGFYLSDYLVRNGYDVWGVSRSITKNRISNLINGNIAKKVNLIEANVNDDNTLFKILQNTLPDEIYNLSGQSSVGLSYNLQSETLKSITVETLNHLIAIKNFNPKIKYFNAASSECFGDTNGRPISEASPMNPTNPYGIAKAAAAQFVRLYRDIYGLFACNAFLFNHESPLRSENFLTKKIVNGLLNISHGSNEKITIGNPKIIRDWGLANEFVEAFPRMLALKEPGDFIVATGTSISLESFVEHMFKQENIDWKKHIVIDNSLSRPNEIYEIRANVENTKKRLSWLPSTKGIDVAKKLYLNSKTTFELSTN